MKKMFMAAAGLLCLVGMASAGTTSVREKALSPISIYDEGHLLELSIEDVGKYHGDICPCVVVSFRAMKLAISKLWEDEIPDREDFKIISSLPSDGSEDTFEFITRVKKRGDFSFDLPQGTSKLKTSGKNYSFVFIRKSTDKRIKISVKKRVFQEIDDRFFEIRKKIKLQKATKKEEKIFRLEKSKLKYVFMSLPPEDLFEFEYIKSDKNRNAK
ncbi:MAG: hypothetical protein J7L54_00445 [Elusimicrobia bacterium]|nr:hypothetical protein [Elusimicrobiota bacterium]